VTEFPPMTEPVERPIVTVLAALTVNVPVTDRVFAVAVMVAVFNEAGLLDVTVKVVEVAPAGIEVVVGTVALEEFEVNVTGKPPVGAALLIVTVATELELPVTEVGLTVSDTSVGAVTVRFALAD
jgi:uncharacterized membrane protein